MLRKLIVLAVTSGLAKKAWDLYKEKEGRASATGESPFPKSAQRKPATRAGTAAVQASPPDKPDAA